MTERKEWPGPLLPLPTHLELDLISAARAFVFNAEVDGGRHIEPLTGYLYFKRLTGFERIRQAPELGYKIAHRIDFLNIARASLGHRLLRVQWHGACSWRPHAYEFEYSTALGPGANNIQAGWKGLFKALGAAHSRDPGGY